MTISKKARLVRTKASSILVVYGLDPNGRSRGARFYMKQLDKVASKARSMNFELFEASTSRQRNLAGQLPPIRSERRAYIPLIKRELYEKLFVAFGGLVRARSQSLSVGDVLGSYATRESMRRLTSLPRNWNQIAPGHVVLGSVNQDGCWFDAIVLQRDRDTLTLMYANFPDLPKFELHVSEIGLINPASQ